MKKSILELNMEMLHLLLKPKLCARQREPPADQCCDLSNALVNN